MVNLMLRLQYLLIGAVIGFVMALFVALGIFFLFLWILWMFVYRNNPWPDWTTLALFISFSIPFLLIYVSFLVFALKYAIRLEKSENEELIQTNLKKHSRWGLNAFIFILILMTASLILRQWKAQENQANKLVADRLAPQLVRIKNITLSQEADNLKIAIETNPVYNGKYQLVVRVQANGYAKCGLLQYFETIPSRSQKKDFEFTVPFKDIEKAYRDQIPNYIHDWDSVKGGIDEFIEIKATLELFETDAIAHAKIVKLNLPFSEMKGVGMFYFNCDKNACKIVQSKEESK